jgi:hypothetical protein
VSGPKCALSTEAPRREAAVSSLTNGLSCDERHHRDRQAGGSNLGREDFVGGPVAFRDVASLQAELAMEQAVVP